MIRSLAESEPIVTKAHLLTSNSDMAVMDGDTSGSFQEMQIHNYQKLYGQRNASAPWGAYSTTRRQPEPYPVSKFKWDPLKNIANIPSVAPADSLTSGLGHGLSPMRFQAKVNRALGVLRNNIRKRRATRSRLF